MPSKEELMEAMPSVGDRLVRTPNMHKGDTVGKIRPQACVVDYVNKEKLWYRVRFENGTRECYKMPDIEPVLRGACAHQ